MDPLPHRGLRWCRAGVESGTLHRDEYTAFYLLGVKYKYDFAYSNFGAACTACGGAYGTSSLASASACGGYDGMPRADGGDGMDHRQLLVDLVVEGIVLHHLLEHGLCGPGASHLSLTMELRNQPTGASVLLPFANTDSGGTPDPLVARGAAASSNLLASLNEFVPSRHGVYSPPRRGGVFREFLGVPYRADLEQRQPRLLGRCER